VVKKFIESLAEVGVPEAPFRKEGKKILVTIAPNKKKK
jgi:translation initiation factor IF-3